MDDLLLKRWWLALQHDFSQPGAVWQLIVVALALISGWYFSRRLEKSVRSRAEHLKTNHKYFQYNAKAIHVGTAAFARVLFPLVTLLVLYVGKLVLKNFYSTNLLSLATTLALSFALVRVLVYLLRKVFHASAVLSVFERAIALVIWIAVALHFTGLLDGVIASLDSILIPLGKAKISVYELLVGALSITVTLLIAFSAGASLERWLMRSDNIDSSLRVVFARIGRALLVVLAILITLPLVGIDLTLLSIFGGALGVGLGLGLQRIASNYVSGFIILLEKRVRIGDTVSVDKYKGAVREIKTRYTVLKAGDGTEVLIPNEFFVSQAITNHSHADPKIRLATHFTLAYDYDPEQIKPLLLQILSKQAKVLNDPTPEVLVTGFNEDGFVMEVGFWMVKPDENGGNLVLSAINSAILRLFAAKSIQMQYSQQQAEIKKS